MIKTDHNEVKALFKEYESLDADEAIGRHNLATKIMEGLVKHDEAEEQTLYATLKERLSDTDDRVKVLEGYEEHAMASDLIKKLKKLPSADEDFTAKFAVLHEAVEHHIKDEEGKIHKVAREVLERDELDQLGSRFQEAKKRVTVAS